MYFNNWFYFNFDVDYQIRFTIENRNVIVTSKHSISQDLRKTIKKEFNAVYNN